MSWELVKVVVGYGIALYVFIAVVRFFDNNSSNWKRLDRIERMLEEMVKKDRDKDTDKDEPEK